MTIRHTFELSKQLLLEDHTLSGAEILEFEHFVTQALAAPSHPLIKAFDAAILQATRGKGVRHGGDMTPFMEQPWRHIAEHTGYGGLIFQMVKKAQESCGKANQEDMERELLGALVYGGMAYLYLKEKDKCGGE